MQQLVVIIILLLFPSSTIFSTQTQTFSDAGFHNIWLWQLSKTAVDKEKGISLSYDTEKKYSSPQTLWTSKQIGKNIYLGTTETASVIKINSAFEEEVVYTNPEKSLIGSITADGTGILFSTSPDSELIHLDTENKVTKTIAVGNSYIWDIIPNPQGGFSILTGSNAEVYEYNNGVLSKPLIIENEEHLLQGLYIENTLWILAEKALYKKEGDKFIALAGFEGTASSFIYHNGIFYVVQSWPTQNEDKKKEQVISCLVSVEQDGRVEKLLSLTGFYFTAIGVFKNQIVVGGDQFGFYALYDLVTKKPHYATLGEGKILKTFSINNQLMLLTSDPSGLWLVDQNIAKEGFFISEIYNAEHAAHWGEFNPKTSIPVNTSIDFFIQSGVVENPLYWSDWKKIQPGEKIDAPNAQFLRYKAILKSLNGKACPYVYNVSFPYTQINLTPSIDSVNIEQNHQEVIISWSASDPNKDTLEYDIYLSDDGLAEVKINTEPIMTTNYIFPNYLYPSGDKRITLVARDRPSNSDASALEDTFTSIPIMFDSEPPTISNILVQKQKETATISFSVEDKYTNIKQVSYTINGKQEVFLLPQDGIFDQKYKEFNFSIPLSEKVIFLQIHAVDSANNMSSKGTTILKME